MRSRRRSHGIEEAHPEVLTACKAFLLKRSKGQPPVDLSTLTHDCTMCLIHPTRACGDCATHSTAVSPFRRRYSSTVQSWDVSAMHRWAIRHPASVFSEQGRRGCTGLARRERAAANHHPKRRIDDEGGLLVDPSRGGRLSFLDRNCGGPAFHAIVQHHDVIPTRRGEKLQLGIRFVVAHTLPSCAPARLRAFS